MDKLYLKKLIKQVLCLLIFFQSFSVVYAAEFTFGQIPSVSDPGRISRNIQAEEPSPQLSARPTVSHMPEPKSKMPPEAAKIKFKLNGVNFVGNTVYSSAELTKIFQPSLGKTITLADLEKLVQDVTRKYRTAGYILTRAILPAQEIKQGVVKIQVIEGYVSKVTIAGDPGRIRYLIQRYADNILRSKPLQIAVMETQMLYANDIPGASVRAVLTPSETVPGSADLSLIVERKGYSAAASYDDYGTRFIGPQEYSVSATLNSVLFGGDSNTGRVVATSDMSQLRYLEFVHTEIVGSHGTNLAIGSNYTQTKPGFLLDAADIIGESFSVYGNVYYPWIRARSKNVMLRGGANYQNVTSTIIDLPFYQDRIRSLSLGAYLDIVDHWQGYDTLQFDASHGFPIWGAKNHELQSRPQGNTDFSKFVVSVSRLQPAWKRFSVYFAMQGQYAFNALLTTEQYAFGGPLYGRGYGPSEIIGDRGVASKLEVRADTSPEFRFLQTIQYYVFYDAGMVWNIDAISLPGRQSATSAGLGARVNFMPLLSGEVYLAKPLSHKALTLTPLDQNAFQPRVFFQLVARL